MFKSEVKQVVNYWSIVCSPPILAQHFAKYGLYKQIPLEPMNPATGANIYKIISLRTRVFICSNRQTVTGQTFPGQDWLGREGERKHWRPWHQQSKIQSLGRTRHLARRDNGFVQ